MHQEFEPSPDLRNSIRCFWYNRNDFGKEETGFEVVPDGYAEIIFHFGSGCAISSNGNLHPLPSPFMIGLLNKPVLFYSKNKFEVIGIRCFPWTVFDLLQLPAGAGSVRQFAHPVASLHASLAACISENHIQNAITILNQFFQNTNRGISADHLLSKAGAAMRSANGFLPVSGVAAAAHATVRTLERKFRQSSGHTVKDVSGLMRFEQVRNRLWLSPEVNLAGLAHELGYTDQAHLSREFKRYSGTTPAAFARKAKQETQIPQSDFVAFVQA